MVFGIHMMILLPLSGSLGIFEALTGPNILLLREMEQSKEIHVTGETEDASALIPLQILNIKYGNVIITTKTA